MKKIEKYKDIIIKADTNLHDQISNLILNNFDNNISIADIGCGEGALALRLYDEGYKNITCFDIDTDQFKLESIKIEKYDANIPITNQIKNKYDLVICVEIIEHIWSPYQLMHDIKEILKPGGFVILSTPNIQSSLSRIIYLIDGDFHQFKDSDLSYGHINPISSFYFRNILKELEYDIVKKIPGGTWGKIIVPKFKYIKNISVTIKTFIGNILYFFLSTLYPIMKGDKDGWVTIYLLKKRS